LAFNEVKSPPASDAMISANFVSLRRSRSALRLRAATSASWAASASSMTSRSQSLTDAPSCLAALLMRALNSGGIRTRMATRPDCLGFEVMTPLRYAKHVCAGMNCGHACDNVCGQAHACAPAVLALNCDSNCGHARVLAQAAARGGRVCAPPCAAATAAAMPARLQPESTQIH